MTGFLHSPLADIAALKDLLKDQYSEESVPKELVQNADDAAAQNLHFAWWDGSSEAETDLLRGPAILVLNDGEFSSANAEGIQYLRVGTKAGSAETIGKFGVGMKGVFNICEAFIFMASANQPAAEGSPFCRALNPWFGSGVHPEWDRLDDDARVLFRTVEEWQTGLERWFCLWLPVRTRHNLGGRHPIVPNYVSREEFFDQNFAWRVAQLFPFLISLQRIGIWEGGPKRPLVPVGQACLRPDAIRRSRESLKDGESRELGGIVDIVDQKQGAKPAATEKRVEFVAYEVLIDDEAVGRARLEDGEWPERVEIDRASGILKTVQEKAIPHAGVALVALRGAGQDLESEIRRAVFLPLQKKVETLGIPGGDAIRLYLHGRFLVDAGRHEITSNSSWNRELEKRGCQRFLLEGLAAFVRRFHFPTNTVGAMTRALQSSEYLQNQQNLKSVTASVQWLSVLGPGGPVWSLRPSSEPFCALPPLPSGAAWAPGAIFPGLEAIRTEVLVTFDNAPRISGQEPSKWGAFPGIWNRLFENAPAGEIFNDHTRLRYVRSLIENERRRSGGENELSIGEAAPLRDLLRAGLKSLEAEPSPELQKAITSFVGLLPEETWFSFGSGPGNLTFHSDRDLVRQLSTIPTKAVVVPSDLAPQRVSSEGLPADDAIELLQGIAKLLAKRPDSKLSLVALGVLGQVAEPDRIAVEKTCGGLEVFRVYSVSESRERRASWQRLREWKSGGVLFVPGSDLTEPLQGALKDTPLYRLVGADAAQILFPDEGVLQCDAAACTRLLRAGPQLSKPDRRMPLLKKLISLASAGADASLRAAIRYLMHGDPDRREDAETALIAHDQGREQSVWNRIADQATAARRAAWRWVPEELAALVPPSQRGALGVQIAGRSVIEQELLTGSDSLSWLKADLFDADERTTVLLEVDSLGLWKRLPLHETVEGTFVTLDENAVLVEGAQVPRGLADHVLQIRPPRSTRLLALYRERIRSWSPFSCIQTVLATADPAHFATELLDAIETAVDKDQSHALLRLQQELRQSRWLPTRQKPIQPERVLVLKEIQNEATTLLSAATSAGLFCSPSDIPEAVTRHRAFPFVRDYLFARDAEAFARLGRLLAAETNLALGLSLAALRNVSLKTFAEVFGATCPAPFPAHALLAKVIRDRGEDLEALSLAEELCGELPTSSLRVLLDHIADVVRRSKGEPRDRAQLLHRAFFEALVTGKAFKAAELSQLSLPSQAGRWVQSETLTLTEPGTSPSNLLDDSYRAVLEKSSIAVALVDADAQVSSMGPRRISQPADVWAREYFRRWRDRVPTECIGVFLALLGDDKSIRAEAEKCLLPRYSVRSVRDRLDEGWDFEIGREIRGMEHLIDGVSSREFVILTCNALVRTNLVGETFEAARRSAPTHLFEDRIRDVLLPGAGVAGTGVFRRCTLTMRPIDPERVDTADLVSLLRNSTEYLLREVYGQTKVPLGALWEEVSQGEQLDLELAQRLIIDNGFFYFRQLADPSFHVLQSLLAKWQRIRYASAEAERLPPAAERKLKIANDSAKVRKELQDLLEKNGSFQRDVLRAIRRKLTHYQYEASSVPFELFQNADDAVVELREMQGGRELEPWRMRATVRVEPGIVRIVHFGRSINRFRAGDFDGEEGMRRGYNRDLEKMLVLSSSDKSSGGVEVTGKFGLGFKSVFLVSSLPRVLSERLAFMVVGGVFPQQLPDEDLERLRRAVAGEAEGDPSTGTVIELPLDEGADDSATVFVSAFESIGHLLPVFARGIREVVLDVKGEGRRTTRWDGRALMQVDRAAVGDLDSLIGMGLARTRILRLECGSGAVAAFVVGRRGLEPLPEDVPTIWVTAPTRERLDIGFALGGPFALDVGRAQLAGVEGANREVAESFGDSLGGVLEELYGASSNWPSFLEELGLAADTKRDEFWRSFWRITTSVRGGAGYTTPARELVWTVIWSTGRGMNHLLSMAPVLPTELRGPYGGLTRLGEVRYWASPILSQPVVFERVSEWPGFTSWMGIGQIVSAGIHAQLKSLLPSPPRWGQCSISDVLEHEVGEEGKVLPDVAERLGSLLTRSWLREQGQATRDNAEYDAILESLKGLKFLSHDGAFREAGDLLVRKGETEEQDEALRVAFAPPGRVLQDAYSSGTALEFFLACRGKLRAPAEVLLQWGLGAADDDRRVAFLYYLLKGNLAYDVGLQAKARKNGTWLEDLPGSRLLGSFAPEDRQLVLSRLGFIVSLPEWPPIRVLPVASPDESLKKIYAWWKSVGRHRLQEFDQQIYPAARCPVRSEKPPESDSERADWLRLLMLGAMLTEGRAKPGARRNFLSDVCDRQGWVEQASAAEGDLREWVDGFLAYVDEGEDEIEYSWWLRQLPNMLVFGRWIDDYARAFLFVNRIKGRFSLDQITKPRVSADMSRADVDAPPIARLLGIGGCFVMRELVRAGVVRNEAAHEHCYVPGRPVRRLLELIGGPDLSDTSTPTWTRSREIHGFLVGHLGEEKATFDSGFDIPLYLLATSPQELKEVLRIELPDDDAEA